MSRRKVTCPCGDTVFASSDAALFDAVRRHIDDEHPDRNLTDQEIYDKIATDAEDA